MDHRKQRLCKRLCKPVGGCLEVIQRGGQDSTGPEVREEKGQQSGGWVQLALGVEGGGWGSTRTERM